MSNKKLLIEACDTQELSGIFDNVEIQAWGLWCGTDCGDETWGIGCGGECGPAWGMGCGTHCK